MVRTHLSTARLRTFSIALLIAAGFANPANASAIAPTLYYQTDGWVGSGGPSDPTSAITFTGASHATNPVSLPGQFSLGNFDVPSLQDTEVLTATNTPFHVILTMGVESAAKGAPQSWATSKIEISGVLNGTIVGNTQSSMVATVTSIQQLSSGTLPFPLSDFQVLGPITLTPFADNQVKWASRGNRDHDSLSSQLTGQVSAVSAVPEPTTMAVFCVGIAGYAIRRRQRRADA